MNGLFIQLEDETQVKGNGFLVKPLLRESQLKAIEKLYQTYFKSGTENFYSSSSLKDGQLKKRISEELSAILLPALENRLQNYKSLGAQFLVKNPGQTGKMPFHQDWTVVDETKYRSYTIWFCLNQLTETNGALQLVPGSHEFSRVARSPDNYSNLHEVQGILKHLSQTINMNAGDGLIFDHSLIHGSGPNFTTEPRIAVALGFVHKHADLFFYHKSGTGEFSKYKVNDDFFLTFPNDGRAPEDAVLIEKTPASFESVKAKDIMSALDVTSHNTTSPKAIAPLFIDKSIQKEFEQNGYVKLKLLDEENVKELLSYYTSLSHDHIKDYGFHISLENKNPDYVSGVFSKLYATLLPKLNPILHNYKAFTASYVIKEAGLENLVPPHQDWTFVDEERYCSATVWIPLMDVTEKNGALALIKGSHKVFNYPRISPSPQVKSVLSNHAFTLFPYTEVIEMFAGEALIFNNKTIHASPPNVSGTTRIGAGIGITQKEAGLVHHYKIPGNNDNVAIFEVDESFFPKFNNSALADFYARGETPANLKIKETYLKTTPSFSDSEISALVSSIPGVKANTALMKSLDELYKKPTPNATEKKPVEEKTIVVEKEILKENRQYSKSKDQREEETRAAKDNRTFFQKYTPANIIAEIKYRMRQR